MEPRKQPSLQAVPEVHFLTRDAVLGWSAQKGIFDVLTSDGEKTVFDLSGTDFQRSCKQFTAFLTNYCFTILFSAHL